MPDIRRAVAFLPLVALCLLAACVPLRSRSQWANAYLAAEYKKPLAGLSRDTIIEVFGAPDRIIRHSAGGEDVEEWHYDLDNTDRGVHLCVSRGKVGASGYW